MSIWGIFTFAVTIECTFNMLFSILDSHQLNSLISANTVFKWGQNLLNQHCRFQMRRTKLTSSQSILTFGPKRRKGRLENGHKSKHTRIRCQQHDCVQQERSAKASGIRHSHLPSLQEDAKATDASDYVWPSILQGVHQCIY